MCWRSRENYVNHHFLLFKSITMPKASMHLSDIIASSSPGVIRACALISLVSFSELTAMVTSPPWYDEPLVRPGPSNSIGVPTCKPSFSASSMGKDIMGAGVSKPVFSRARVSMHLLL